jgi:hypothetical protein
MLFSIPTGEVSTPVPNFGTCAPNGVIPPVGKTGICFDNAAAESFNATLKKELIHLHVWAALKKVRQVVFEYIETYYNRKRIQRHSVVFLTAQALSRIPGQGSTSPRMKDAGPDLPRSATVLVALVAAFTGCSVQRCRLAIPRD